MALKRQRVAETNQVKAHVTRKSPRVAKTKHLKARAVRKRPRVPETNQVKARVGPRKAETKQVKAHAVRKRPRVAETKQGKARAARKRPRVAETDQGKARRSTKRRRKGPPFDWEALCPDLKQLIIDRVSFRHLARAAPTCRYFQKAYLDRAAEERAKLIAVAEGASGKALLSTFAAGLRRAMSGSVSFPGLDYEGQGGDLSSVPRQAVLITNVGEPTCSAIEEDWEEWRSCTQPNAIIYKRYAEDSIFSADLNLPRLGADDPRLHCSRWRMRTCKRGHTSMTLEVRVNIQQLPAVLGCLLAAFAETPGASRPSSIWPPTVHLKLLIKGGSRGATGVRQVEALVPSFKSFLSPGRIYYHVPYVCHVPDRHWSGVVVETSTTKRL